MSSQHDPRKALGLMLLLVVAGAGASAGVSFMGQTIGVSETKVQLAVVVPAEDFSEDDVTLQQALVDVSRNGSTFGVSFEAGNGTSFTVSIPIENRADVEVLTQLHLGQTDGNATLTTSLEPTGSDNFGDNCEITSTTSLAPSHPGAWEFHIPATCKDRVTLEVSVPSSADRDFYRIVGTLDAQGDDGFVGTLTDAGDSTLSSPSTTTSTATPTPTPTSGDGSTSADNVSVDSSTLLTGEQKIVQFGISSTSNVSLERFGFESQNDLANVTESGSPHRFNVTGITTNASRENATAYTYDNTTYAFTQTGVMDNESGTVTLDAVHTSPIEVHGFAADRSTADLIVRLGYGDGSSDEVYLNASVPTNDSTDTTTDADSLSVVSGSLKTGEEYKLEFKFTSSEATSIQDFAIETQNDLNVVDESGDPHKFEITSIDTDAKVDFDSPIAYNGTIYTFPTTGYIKASEEGHVKLDKIQRQGETITVHGFAANRSVADMVITVTLGDGSQKEFYINATEPTAAESLSVKSGSLQTGDQYKLEYKISSTDGFEIETFAIETQNDLDLVDESGDPHKFEVKSIYTDAKVDFASPIAYDGTTYTFPTTGYMKGSEDGDVLLDAIRSNSDLVTINGFAADRASADMIITLTFGDGTSKEFYIDAELPTDSLAAAYVAKDSGNLQTMNTAGSKTTYDTDQVGAISPLTTDLDGDGDAEIAYVNNSNHLRVIDSRNETTTLDASENAGDESSGTSLGIGDWDDDGTDEIVYTRNGYLYEVEYGGTPSNITDANGNRIPVGSIAGIADFDGDGNLDIVYVEPDNNEIQFLDQSGDPVQTLGVNVDTIEAVSTPANYDGDGTIEVAYVDDNADIQLVDLNGMDGSFDPGYDVRSTALAGVDWTNDGHPDLIHLDNDDQALLYYDVVNTDTGYLNDASGSIVIADNNIGVK